jgi:protein O-GlcNAc transferase
MIFRQDGAVMTNLRDIFLAAVNHYSAGRPTEAAALFLRLTEADPEDPHHPVNAAIMLRCSGRIGEAEILHRRALIVRPDLPPALGGLAENLADPSAARRWSRRAMALAPADPACCEAWARAAERCGDYRTAAAGWARRLAAEPQNVIAQFNRALMSEQDGRIEDALIAYDRTRRLDPAFAPGVEKTTLHLLYACWKTYDADVARLTAAARAGAGAPQLELTYIPSTPAEQLTGARGHIRRAGLDRAPILPPAPVVDKPRLTVGYVSGDFREHAVAYLVAELFELHDRRAFRVLGYSSWPHPDDSPMRRRLLAAFDGFTDISALSAADGAALLRRDGVDVAVDLSGWTRHNRLDVFARRPAPLQLTWLGYPGTTGADFFDGVLADDAVAPAADQPFFSEPLIRLPRCFQINDRRRRAVDETPTKTDCGLPEDGFVFACFNHAPKISPAIFDIWMRLLRRTPGAALWLRDGPPLLTGNLRAEAAARGVDPDRLVFASHLPMSRHLARYRLVDLVVDTFPYGGHTTVSDALWMGCPAVVRRGDTFASRVAAGLLISSGLPEAVAGSAAEYEATALSLAGDPARRAEMRARLRATAAACAGPFDAPGFTRDLEAIYRRLWREKAAAEK